LVIFGLFFAFGPRRHSGFGGWCSVEQRDRALSDWHRAEHARMATSHNEADDART
jgi:hypothetical protein